MNTKYQTSAQLSEDIYNNLSYSELLGTLNAVKLSLPFCPCECSFIYSVNNEIHTCSISDIPKALNPAFINYWAVDFTDCKNSVSVTVTHNSLYVSVSLPYDYQNTKAFANDLLVSTVKNIEQSDNNHKPRNKKANIFKRILKEALSYIALLVKILKAFF